MCGIAGFVPGTGGSQEELLAMLTPIRHRGPDQSGIHYSPYAAIGHVRLSIIDLEGGVQPKVSREGNVLAFNGEIYNHSALRRELLMDGAKLDDDSDTAVLFELLNRHPIDQVLNKIDGMFAFSFYHASSETLYLARDRLGEKPLYYFLENRHLYFASEVGALRALNRETNRDLNPEHCLLYLMLEYLPGQLTAYTHIESLLPGHYTIFRNGELRAHCYWSADNIVTDPSRITIVNPVETKSSFGMAQKISQLDQLLATAVQQQLYADVPVGVFLSGGIDSSLIAAYCRKANPRIEAFTVRLPYSSYDESAQARIVADHLNIPINIIDLTQDDVLWAMDMLDETLDEPFADYSLLPSLLLCRATRQKVKVALGGDGADELFAGYPNFHVQNYAALMQHIPAGMGNWLRLALTPLLSGSGYMNLPFKLQQLSYGFGQPTYLQSYHWMSALSLKEIESAALRPFNFKQQLDARLDNFNIGRAPDFSPQTLLHLFLKTYLPYDILMKMDRASMYNSIEVRSPFLAKPVIEYTLSLPFNVKLKGSQGKYLLRQLARQYLPESIVQRRKHGFAMPLAELIRGLLRDRFIDAFNSPTNPVYEWLDKRFTDTLLRQHLRGDLNHAKKLWAIYRLLLLAQK